MASVILKSIYKVYPNGTKAVNDFSMEIADKEFIVFVGPSGCGKSTVLRMIAGLEEISAGELMIDNVVVNDVECKLRDTAMVFQNYALYPHMTVADNMAFPLKMIKLTKEEKVRLRKHADELYPRKRVKKGETLQQNAISKEVVSAGGTDKKFAKLRARLKKIFNFNIPFFNTIFRPVRVWQTHREEIYTRVIEIAKVLGLEDYLGKKPGAMSGGQRQRVALGRAMVRNPKVFLLDEPLSNLDAKLRTQMRSEITKLHNRLKTTFIYVTHDQTEAMTMGDRIIVMKLGTIQQIDTPANLYDYPANLFVAGFIGTPSMNFLDAVVTSDGEMASVTFAQDLKLTFSAEAIKKFQRRYLGKTVVMGVRPEDFIVSDNGVECIITNTEMLGRETLLYCDFNTENATDYENGTYPVIVKVEGASRYRNGDIIKVNINADKVHYFDKDTEVCISNRLVTYNEIDVTAESGFLHIGNTKLALPNVLSSLNGKYVMNIPSGAFICGKDCLAEVIETENLKDGCMARIDIGGIKVYGLFKDEVEGNIGVDIDWHRVSFASASGENVPALDTVNRLDVKLVKKHLTKEEQNALPEGEKRTFDIKIDIAGKIITCPFNVLKRLLSASDRKLFGVEMVLEFGGDAIGDAILKEPEDVGKDEPLAEGLEEAKENTFTAQISKIYDYGKRIYAKCSFFGTDIILPADGEDDEISFGIDLEKCSIYDKKLDIKIS